MIEHHGEVELQANTASTVEDRSISFCRRASRDCPRLQAVVRANSTLLVERDLYLVITLDLLDVLRFDGSVVHTGLGVGRLKLLRGCASLLDPGRAWGSLRGSGSGRVASTGETDSILKASEAVLQSADGAACSECQI